MLKRASFLFFICCVCVFVLTVACRDRGAELEKKLIKTVKQGPGTVFQMRDLTPFEWDRMYVIQPYTPPEAINRKLGFEWAGAKSSSIGTFDTIRLLVFVNGKEVVADVEYKVRDGFFDDGGRHEYSAGEARFAVEEVGEGEKVLTIRWLP
jgi:hypothetical protein